MGNDELSTEEDDKTRESSKARLARRDRQNNSQACLIVIHGAHLGKRIALDKDEVMLGRAKNADIQIHDNFVSRKHAVIRKRRQDLAFVIEDQNSTNGTFINMERQAKSVLYDQDLISIGETTFKFIADDSLELAYHEELHKLANLDPMLQIHNKKFFLEYLEQKYYYSQLSQTQFSLVLFDVDHFKRVNDTYGHQTGDRVLQHIAATVKANLRSSDIFSRYGGEEFSVVLPESDADQARFTAEKLRRVIETTGIRHHEAEISVTISLGVASFRPVDAAVHSCRELIEQADNALYRAKKTGRNRVVVYQTKDKNAR
jgi:two-component system cell cycle response regulator